MDSSDEGMIFVLAMFGIQVQIGKCDINKVAGRQYLVRIYDDAFVLAMLWAFYMWLLL